MASLASCSNKTIKLCLQIIYQGEVWKGEREKTRSCLIKIVLYCFPRRTRVTFVRHDILIRIVLNLELTHLHICKTDISISPINPGVLHHQPVLVHRPHLREDRHQFILKAVSGDPGDIHLTTPGWGRTLPPLRWPTINSLPIPLQKADPIVILKLIKFSLFKIIVFLIKALQIQIFKLRHFVQSNHG